MEWSRDARRIIAEALATLPEVATLAERKKAISAAYPWGPREYWPYKAWCKASREALARYQPSKPTALDLMPRDPATGRPVIL